MFDLTSHIGGITKEELEERMTARELGDWIIKYNLEPFGVLRDDLRQAFTSCVIANANRDKKTKPKPFTPQDFMPFWTEGEKPKQSIDEMMAIGKNMAMLSKLSNRRKHGDSN